MSYDILVFDPAHAPSEREAFLEWWDGRDHWSEPHSRNDPAFTTPKLRAWFFDMIERFPALNGPYAVSRDQRSADYCIGYHVIYVAIWFDKQATHERAFELAGEHTLGFFEASSLAARSGFPAMELNSCLAPSTKRNLLNQLQIHELQPLSDHIAPVMPSSTSRLMPKIREGE